MKTGHDVKKRMGNQPANAAHKKMPALSKARFAAIDFETADYNHDSACALSVVRVEQGEIVDKWYGLIRPPREHFVFSYLHGIEWKHVEEQPDFGGRWPHFRHLLSDVDFIAAHNASFDRSVLYECCDMSGIEHPQAPFLCSMRLARKAWGIFPTKLSHVCRALDIPLRHHDAASDAHACAQIVLRALRERKRIPNFMHPYQAAY